MASPAEVRPIESRTVGDLVTTELRRSILTGALPPGQSFSLRELASRLDVSFIPVREALRNLESEGLVVIRPGRSVTIAPIDFDDLHAIYRLRRLLEPDLARRSCTRISDAELTRLERDAADFGDPDRSMDAIYDAHRDFHLALFGSAATAWDVRVLTTLWRAAERYIRIGFGLLDPDPEEHHRRRHAHESLLSVYRRRDPDAAARAVDEHLDHNEKMAGAALGTAAAGLQARETAG
ncbi:GntR family transcriptional regulator [Pseudofrankia inefficax]|uniref:Transcriptional regulator, GntR family n=1 Tax=Pseudofrankia inefficax (strain DSM 45817 / CECT 9037 / DDB 130130 / EuI1c) TaxID=298654 RepID=E3IUK1_PSEI1|nr:GntR family transcriptional regulator [Pseudofrankia inefficax]ADP83686.1 transcriptional regulator, GntR family [Pseudofrankia inefficax]